MVRRSIKKAIVKKTILLKKVKPKKVRVIKRIEPENFFWVYNGPIVKNLHELASAIEEMSDNQYYYHTKRDGNDFANWLENVLFLRDLANKIRRTRSREGTMRIIRLYKKNI